jgi:hypothetical protein
LESHSVVTAMMRDTDHVEWHASSLEKKLDEKLGRNFETFKNEVESVEETMTSLHEELQCFSPLQEEYDNVSLWVICESDYR